MRVTGYDAFTSYATGRGLLTRVKFFQGKEMWK